MPQDKLTLEDIKTLREWIEKNREKMMIKRREELNFFRWCGEHPKEAWELFNKKLEEE